MINLALLAVNFYQVAIFNQIVCTTVADDLIPKLLNSLPKTNENRLGGLTFQTQRRESITLRRFGVDANHKGEKVSQKIVVHVVGGSVCLLLLL